MLMLAVARSMVAFCYSISVRIRPEILCNTLPTNCSVARQVSFHAIRHLAFYWSCFLFSPYSREDRELYLFFKFSFTPRRQQAWLLSSCIQDRIESLIKSNSILATVFTIHISQLWWFGMCFVHRHRCGSFVYCMSWSGSTVMIVWCMNSLSTFYDCLNWLQLQYFLDFPNWQSCCLWSTYTKVASRHGQNGSWSTGVV